ncbi:citrate/2-methylcitrate synthase [Ralstonia nicotianae]
MAMLAVKPQTLYAYVSRGLIRAVSAQPGSKGSLYYRQDVEVLQLRGRKDRPRVQTAQSALRIGGEPVLKSGITAITDEGPCYRGVKATDLARSGRPFEDCIELLWSGVLPARSLRWQAQSLPPAFDGFLDSIAAAAAVSNTRRLFSLSIEALAICRGANAELSAGASVLAARQLMQVLASMLGFLRERPRFEPAREHASLAEWLCGSLDLEASAANVQMLNAALIICADHELAPSTFVARIAASAGADLYSCVSSALGAFEGIFTGLGCDLAEDMLRRCPTPAKYVESLREIMLTRQPLPGYNHAIYPDGDPRAAVLLNLLHARAQKDKRAEIVLASIRAARARLKVMPSLNVGLAGVTVALGLPARTAGALMALARTAGWIAHVFEQRLAGFLVRPRVEYVGAITAAPR